jgi:hypothetical protein
MRRTRSVAGIAVLATLLVGCATGPLLDNPLLVQPDANAAVENPVYVPLGPPSYGAVFEKVIDVLDDYFVIPDTGANRYAGTIDTLPRISPGFERYFLPGSPDCGQRWHATLQSIRHYARVHIVPADDGGFFIDVRVFKELEDVPRPSRVTAGVAVFRSDNILERQFEVIEPTFTEPNWIFIGEDVYLEQEILQRIKKCL